MFVTSLLNLSIYFGCTHADFISLSHSRLLAMTGVRSCLERPVPLSSWSITVVAGRPLERLPCFGSQRSSWETVSLERSFKEGESSLWFPFSFFFFPMLIKFKPVATPSDPFLEIQIG